MRLPLSTHGCGASLFLALLLVCLPGLAVAVSIPFAGTVTGVSVSGVDWLGVSTGASVSGLFEIPDSPAPVGGGAGYATYCCALPPIQVAVGGATYTPASNSVSNSDIDVFDTAGGDGVLYSYAVAPFGSGIQLFVVDLSGAADVLSGLALPSDPATLQAFSSRQIRVALVGTDARTGGFGQVDLMIDAHRFGSQPPVPEPTAAVGFAVGLAVMAAAARRRG